MRSHPCDGCGVSIETCGQMFAHGHSCCAECWHEEDA